jgi:uncharacterized protein (TIGR02466 family)
MAQIRTLFATRVYHASLAGEAGYPAFNAELEAACRMLAREDNAGRAWSRANGYPGYTSYASLDDLPSRASVFGDLKRRLDRRAAAFGHELAFDLGHGGRLELDSLWVSLLRRGAGHSSHIHPSSVVSGVIYVAAPTGAGALRLEDPRLPLMMAAPPRRADAVESLETFVKLEPAAGTILMWESWLRHEVLPGAAKSDRISLSFNYAWAQGRRRAAPRR